MTDFTYENRPIKKGDAVTVIPDVQRNVAYGKDKEFFMDNKNYNQLDKLYSIVYVYEISKDGEYCKVQTKKGTQGVKVETFFPVELFKIVKVPKMQDVVNWLYDNQLITYPEQWIFFKSEMQSISRYIIKIFQTNLRAIYLANKTCNHLYNSHDPLEILVFYKTLIQQLGLQYHKRYDKFNQMTKRKQFIDACLSINPMWHTRDAISIYELNNRGLLPGDYISNNDRLEFYKDPKKKLKYENDKANLDKIKERITENEKVNKLRAMENDTRYIKELNQSVIDELELTVFNVKTLPNRNQILFIFIDKDNNKRFYVQDFNFTFFVSRGASILENDYIVEFDESMHIPFSIQSFEILKNLKFAVNDNHKRFMKLGSF